MRDTDAVLPRLDVTPAARVVSTLSRKNGLPPNSGHPTHGITTTTYRYGGLKYERGTGRGSLGFRWIKSMNSESLVETSTEYRQDWPFTGQAALIETRKAGVGNSGLLKRVTNTWAQTAGSATPATFVYLSQQAEQSWDLDGTAMPTSSSAFAYTPAAGQIQQGNLSQGTVSLNDGSSKATVNEYWPANTSGGNWLLGRLKKTTVTSIKP